MAHRSPSRPNPRNTDDTRAALAQMQTLAWLLDSSIWLPGGFRIGVDAILGLIPFAGDMVGVLFSSYIVIRAAKLGVPRSVLLRMVMNVAIEGVVGLVPLLGDVFDAAWKANQRNVSLLARHLEQPGKITRASRWFVALCVLALIGLTSLLVLGSILLIKWAWDAVSGAG